MSELASKSDAGLPPEGWRLVDREAPLNDAGDTVPELPGQTEPSGQIEPTEPTEQPEPAGPPQLSRPAGLVRLSAPNLPLRLNGRLTAYSVRKVRHRWLSSLAPWRDRRLGDACGLWLAPCNVVHTLGLWHAVDVVFLKADGTIARVAKRVPPWRFLSCSRASSALRLRAGMVTVLRLKPGMALDLAT
ncbi:DUF192 domain-containing protein [Paucibacter sp. PLA-PC-4]|uniref:DUF192 domain-containing protein n=1 Tax=Paucibacter sp. PLA-PC-4 TaxID=2993655 RepID=UPI0022492717|nr:DUF192 domain-containing protein [Paucibacter sp. PLA-PC-4]MCX2860951.1 DUF192 domain-containing protein [Paucibacter sp. PLA-PC-4]